MADQLNTDEDGLVSSQRLRTFSQFTPLRMRTADKVDMGHDDLVLRRGGCRMGGAYCRPIGVFIVKL